ncbi:MAG: primosomal protein N' [Gammaproteobacteria bacterium]|jgi:primosomal protein N' (replication factor Y)|nr:primosomal protein N' [Gammaproteobacteria bacterium]
MRSHSRSAGPVLCVAVPVPVRRLFDYLPPEDGRLPPRGARVRIPFGGRQLSGVVLGHAAESGVPAHRLKRARLVPNGPRLPEELLAFAEWAAGYYHFPLGEVLQAVVPAPLRGGRLPRPEPAWRAARGAEMGSLAARAVAQRAVLATLLEAAGDPRGAESLAQAAGPGWRRALAALLEKGLAEPAQAPESISAPASTQTGPELNPAQELARDALVGALGGYRSFLLDGITGSGKTEVYLRAAEVVRERGQQTLFLVPEISLTPQLVERIETRFGVAAAVLHSGLSDGARARAWLAAADGSAALVLGTRSAVFAPLRNPGLIVVDEEHDGSFKQQDGFRYHARDLAIVRASRCGIPVVLGTATPSLESLANVEVGRHQRLVLPERTRGATLPRVDLVDLRKVPVREGLSRPLRVAIGETLERGEQALLFLNRRGFAPVLTCYSCGFSARCHRCDARLTWHQRPARLRCHHCGGEAAAPRACPECGDELHPLGEGTERLDAHLASAFPEARIERVDRDTTRRRGTLEAKLQAVHEGRVDILVGTQMLSKGHDFPGVTLVGVINADQGLFGSDFRAGEYVMQQVMQVAGRAGRGQRAGRVLVQTGFPDHPYLRALRQHGYRDFAVAALKEREALGLPPYGYLALMRAESVAAGEALKFLERARACAASPSGVQVLDPVPAPMERRAGRYRAQLLVQAHRRGPLHAFLGAWLDAVQELPETRRVRWSLDVDPMEMY